MQSATVGVVVFPTSAKQSDQHAQTGQGASRDEGGVVVAQPGHTKGLQLVQLERGLRIVDLPGVIFEINDNIQGQKESSVLLRDVVKPENVDNPISVGTPLHSS